MFEFRSVFGKLGSYQLIGTSEIRRLVTGRQR